MHVNTAINELKVKQYGYNDVKEILESITATGESKTRPTRLKKGDVFRAYTGGKKRGQKYQFVNISQKESSKTFSGVAKAMAEQWGTFIQSRNVAACL